jgi:hypothetical protein
MGNKEGKELVAPQDIEQFFNYDCYKMSGCIDIDKYQSDIF